MSGFEESPPALPSDDDNASEPSVQSDSEASEASDTNTTDDETLDPESDSDSDNESDSDNDSDSSTDNDFADVPRQRQWFTTIAWFLATAAVVWALTTNVEWGPHPH